MLYSMKITIDTCLINSANRIPEMNSLERLASEGVIQIVGTERLLQETENNSSRFDKAKSLENLSEPFTVGMSRIGSAYISDGTGYSFRQIANILFPNRNELNENESSDVMHLVSHANSDSDYFVTMNKWDFIHARRTNKNRDGSFKNVKKNKLGELGIKVMLPEEALALASSLKKS